MQISSNLHSNVSRSTRINSSSVHMYIFRLFYLCVILQGFVTQKCNTVGLYTVATRCHTCFAVTLKYTEDSSLTILRHSLHLP